MKERVVVDFADHFDLSSLPRTIRNLRWNIRHNPHLSSTLKRINYKALKQYHTRLKSLLKKYKGKTPVYMIGRCRYKIKGGGE